MFAMNRRNFLKGAAAAVATWATPSFGQSSTDPVFLYVGSYTEPRPARGGEGISIFRLTPSNGNLEFVSTFPNISNPSFLTVDPARRFLYAVNEVDTFEGRQTGSLTSFAIDKDTGSLTLLNQQASMGMNPVHLSIDPTGRFVLVANYSSGNIAVFPIQQDGSLGSATDMVVHQGTPGPNAERQDMAHPIQIQTDPTGQFTIVNDLGLDKTIVYRLNPFAGTLSPQSELAAEPGAGPRYIAYHPLGRWVYRINELNNTMTALEWVAASGEFRNIQSLPTLSDTFDGISSTANVQVAPYGKYVYGTNRGDNSIFLFDMDANTGEMTFVSREASQGDSPLGFGIDPQGNFLIAANQSSNNLSVFKMSRQDGTLSPTGIKADVKSPAAVTIASPMQGLQANDGVTLSVFTNPAFIFDGTGLVRASFAWNAPAAKEVDVRVGAPDGSSLGRFPSVFGVMTDKWVADGTVFFIQDVTDNKPLTADNTLGTVTMSVRTQV